MALDLLPDFIRKHYEVTENRHACAILKVDFPNEWKDLVEVLTQFRLKKSFIKTPGGGKSPISLWFDSAFRQRGWKPKKFDAKLTVDGKKRDLPTHEVDCFKNEVALEIEWNNKDPFFDRDLQAFSAFHNLALAGVGIIITRCDELQQLFVKLNKGPSYGQSTTHMSKLLPRLDRGGGGGCPVLVFGISRRLYVED
jgi:hypothetical protein